jgi:peroxiredoxin
LTYHQFAIFFVVLLLVFGLLAPVVGYSAQLDLRGVLAPPFELPSMDGGFVDSAELFPRFDRTFIVFWDSDCPHCVSSLLGCEEFYTAHLDGDIGIVGIHLDTGDMTDARRLVESNGVTFPQLWDFGGEAGQAYGVPAATFSVFLIDNEGRVVGQRVDPEGNMTVALESLLAQPAPVPYSPAISDSVAAREADRAWNGFVIHAGLRMRFMSVDSRGLLATGPYGEVAYPGNDFLYRVEFDISRRITKYLRAGGLLRISNESNRVLEVGPQYLGREWGSAFAELASNAAMLRLGYYVIYMTPLTLMRWDWNDNPRIGGTAGCGCGAAAGILLLETLESLAPELVFEGATASYRTGGLDTRIYYGIPRRPMRTTYLEFRSTGRDRAHYSLETAGIESVWRRFDPRTESYWKFGVRGSASWQDHRSVDFKGLGYPAPDPWYQSGIVTIDAAIPLWSSFDLEGEWVIWNRMIERGGAVLGLDDPLATNATGGLAGAVFTLPPYVNLRADYIRLDPGFFAPFAALSYQPNREGGRFSSMFQAWGDVVALSLFYKRLREIEAPDANVEKETNSVLGVSVDTEFPNGFGGSIGWLDHSSWRTGSVDNFDLVREALVATIRWRPYKTSLLEFQYQRIDVEESRGSDNEEALTYIYSVYFSSTF